MFKRIFLIAMLVMLVALPALASATTPRDLPTGQAGLPAPLMGPANGILLTLGLLGLGIVMSPGTLVSLQKSFSAIFNEALAAMPPNWPTFSMEVTSAGAGEDYQWLGDTPGMREWLGEKFIKELRGFAYYVPNKDWEATIQVMRKHIEDDQLGMYNPKIRQLAEEGNVHQDALMSELREAATATLCHDGKYFYAANHATGKSGTQSNLITGAGVALANITTDFLKGRAALRKFKTDQGKPFIRQAGKLKLHVTCPPDLEGIFEQLANSTLIGASDNTLKGAFTYSIDSNLTDSIDWYLDYIGSVIKPFVMQMRQTPIFVAMDQPTAENVFMRAAFLYSVEARYNAAFGLWPYSIKINNS